MNREELIARTVIRPDANGSWEGGKLHLTQRQFDARLAYIERGEAARKRWMALPIEERIAIHAKRMSTYQSHTRTRAGDAHEHLYELEPLT